MPLIDELSRAQRVVVVIALGLALGAIGSYLMTLGSGTGFGWYAYAPLNTTLRPPGTGLATWLRLIIWLALIGLWALAAIRVLRPRPPADQGRRSLAPRITDYGRGVRCLDKNVGGGGHDCDMSEAQTPDVDAKSAYGE